MLYFGKGDYKALRRDFMVHVIYPKKYFILRIISILKIYIYTADGQLWLVFVSVKVHAIPVFRMRGRATFQATTKDSVFAIKVWMFETKDCLLEMPSAKYMVRIEYLNVLKDG